MPYTCAPTIASRGKPFLISKGGTHQHGRGRAARPARSPDTADAHCWPSPTTILGQQAPQREDDQLTERLASACQVMNLSLLDHVIVTDGDYYSYREQGGKNQC